MTENDARLAVAGIAPAALARLDRFAELLLAENANQNLVARSTEASLWERHLLDSIQLVRFARPEDRCWLDVGSGAGLPGIVIATLGRWSVTLVESRRKRATFLEEVIRALALPNVEVIASDVKTITLSHDLISARAVGKVDHLLTMTRSCAKPKTRFIFPKGRTARADVEAAATNWHGVFHVEQSLTDPDAGIVIADEVRPR